MPWPTPQDYNEAVQNPRLAFTDADLQLGQPELNQLGLPRPISGNFASVYKIQSGGQRWAARCFVSEVTDLQNRYHAISRYLAAAKLPYTVPFTYISNGIRLQGRSYPLLKMQWVQGESLNAFVERNLGQPNALISLAKVWLKLTTDLKALGLAHGDLQHGNILIVGEQIRLIDYDGMFVPELAGKQSNEIGHRNYQLPSRSEWDYGPYLDNFSAWVIYVSLATLAVHPELWRTHRGGDECLIFRKEDFVKPESSAVLRDLNSSRNDQLRFLIDLFKSLFFLSPRDVPSLDGNLPTIAIQPVKPWWDDFVGLPQPNDAEGGETYPQPESAVVADPGWIIDSLNEDQSITLVRFQTKPQQLRIIAVGSMALAFVIGLLLQLPPTELSLCTSSVFGLNVLLCVIRYANDPSRTDLTVFKKAARAFLRDVRDHQSLLDSVSAQRLSFQEDLKKTEGKLAKKNNKFLAAMQVRIGTSEAQLNRQIQRLNQRRQETSKLEATKLSELQATLGKQISAVDQRIAAVNQRETNEMNDKIHALQATYIDQFLRGRSIFGNYIPSVGQTYKHRLMSAGFMTAADISWKVGGVYGIGAVRSSALMSWRKALESQASLSAPAISSQDRSSIEGKYRQERQMLQSERHRLQVQLDSQVASNRQHFGGIQQSLNQEEQGARAFDAQIKSQIAQEFRPRLATVDAEIKAAQDRIAVSVQELSEERRAAQKQIFALRWKAAKHAAEGRRFASLRFRDYVSKVFSG